MCDLLSVILTFSIVLKSSIYTNVLIGPGQVLSGTWADSPTLSTVVSKNRLSLNLKNLNSSSSSEWRSFERFNRSAAGL